MKGLEALGRTRLSKSFYMRDFLYSEIANFYGIANIPEDPDLAIAAGKKLCEELLEPLADAFGGISIRSAYRSCEVNRFGNENRLNCATNEHNFAGHIWDRRDAEGCMGAMACVVVRRFVKQYEETGDWRPLAWWIHDHLPYSTLTFYPNLAAFNIAWNETPKRVISSQIPPHRGILTKPGMANHEGDHGALYAGFPNP